MTESQQYHPIPLGTISIATPSPSQSLYGDANTPPDIHTFPILPNHISTNAIIPLQILLPCRHHVIM